jgi:hypothetical protein
MKTYLDTTFVLLATRDHDLGLFPAHTARKEAREFANKHRVPVTLRDPVTDELLGTVKPGK